MAVFKILVFFILLSFNSLASELPKEIENEIPKNIHSVIKFLGKNVKLEELVKFTGDPADVKDEKIYFEIKKYKYALVLTLKNDKLVEVYYKFVNPKVKLSSLKNLERKYKKRKDNSHSSGYESYYENENVKLLFRGSVEPTLSSIKITGPLK